MKRATRTAQYTLTAVGTPGVGAAFIACRLAHLFPARIPTRDELVRGMGMSAATAYRWRRAMADARGVAL